ncbi:phosphate ABC transporter substrate-binding protein PstS [Okeania sp.]|uniref:phosphate ABC transporter substrate-binding protein PstS n=1 Tax=Okeania sp. TaxID=3100323 RepID=UPI002B4B6CCD|nr:phosphate ABC transporter substrate-binding protein PstS [Okeania sp.]MEB3342938.1 phosphate ABC transporter substrate-binding protein PstS [Okeania sp.]
MASLGNICRNVLTVTVAAITISVGTLGEAIAQTIEGAGASFPAPLYQRYFQQLKKDTGITVNYNSVGSGKGIESFVKDTVDFAGTDAPPVAAEIEQMPKGLVMVPTAGGAVAVVYNLPGVRELKLSQSVLPDIFAGKITKWNDRRIAKDNPGVDLPDLPIQTVVRADGSGTTFIFSKHLSAVSPLFSREIGASKKPQWLGNPLKGNKNDGVADLVKKTEGAIGYVQDTFARQNNLSTAMLENLRGEFVKPSLEEANKALSGLRFYQNFNPVNEANPDEGYPIVGITWLLIKQNYDSSDDANAIKKMVSWILNQGQNLNNTLEYTRVPKNIAVKILEKVEAQVTSK